MKKKTIGRIMKVMVEKEQTAQKLREGGWYLQAENVMHEAIGLSLAIRIIEG